MGGSTGDSQTAALGLIAQFERQSLGVARDYDNGAGIGDNYTAYRALAERVDEFHVFARLVENRLSDIEPGKRPAQTRHVADVRSRILLLEIDAMHGFLARFSDGGKPWPLGSRVFLTRQQGRLTEIMEDHREIAAQHGLEPLDAALVATVAAQFVAQLDRIQAQESFGTRDFGAGLEDFAATARRQPDPPPPIQADEAPATDAAAPAMPPLAASPAKPEVEEFPVPPAAAPPAPRPAKTAAPASGSFLKPKQKFTVKNSNGNVYVETGGLAIVEDACKHAKMTLNDLAREMGINRAALVLMLNGSDAIEKKPLTQLRAFIMRNGGLI